jgi:exopolysaccharide biosynthesis polyprenyl glycosylphosphotransferase
MDLLCLLLGSTVGIALRLGHEDVVRYVYGHIEGWLLFFGGILVANYLSGSYRLQYMFSRFNLVVTWLFSLFFTMLILSFTSYAWFTVVLGRGVLLLSVGAYSVLSLFLKLLVYRSLFRSELFLCRVAIIGSGGRALALRRLLEHDMVMPAHKVVAFIEVGVRSEAAPARLLSDGVAVLPVSASELESVLRGLSVRLVIIGTEDPAVGARLHPQLIRLRFQGIEVLTPLAANEVYAGKIPLDLLDDETILQMSRDCEFPMIGRAKRVFDLAAATVAGILFAPVALLTAVAIKLSDWRNPVIYSQTRVGQFGVTFRIFKFRTMRVDAEQESGAVWAQANDPRVTWLGRFLRVTRLDEVPQFWNILRGDMSIVGPRPERPEIVARLAEQIPYYHERENVLPGLTGWAQVRYPYGSTVDDARRKLEFDLYYFKHVSISLDLQIILSTLRIVIFGKERSM